MKFLKNYDKNTLLWKVHIEKCKVPVLEDENYNVAANNLNFRFWTIRAHELDEYVSFS